MFYIPIIIQHVSCWVLGKPLHVLSVLFQLKQPFFNTQVKLLLFQVAFDYNKGGLYHHENSLAILFFIEAIKNCFHVVSEAAQPMYVEAGALACYDLMNEGLSNDKQTWVT